MSDKTDLAASEVFLATADLDELWTHLEQAPPREIVLLNPYCTKRGSPPAGLRSRMSGSIAATWESLEKLDALDAQVKLLYEDLLRGCGQALNGVHGENHGERYWRILIGPWLHYLVSAGFDRLNLLRRAFAADAPPRALGLAASSWLVPTDTLDFQLRISEDDYNFQLAGQIMTLLGVAHEKLPLALRDQPLQATPFAGQSLAARLSRRFLSRLRAALSGFEASRSNGRIYLVDTHFSRAQELQLLCASGGKICLNLDAGYPRTSAAIDADARQNLFEQIPKGNEDARILAGLIQHNIPQCFVENYRAIAGHAGRTYRRATPKLIFSTNGWNYNEAFKQWAAGCAERGSLLAGFQHGGGYGRVRLSFNQRHESRILDRFYTWGWKNEAKNVAPMYFPYTPAAAPATGRSAEILYVTTAYPRYFLEISAPPGSMADYLASQRRFVAALSEPARELLRVRMYPHDHGWGTAARWREFAPSVVVEDCRIPFRLRMASCSLCICDHPGTTNFEALAYNVPTLMYWDPAISFFYDEVERDHDMLRRAGILFDSAEAAAFAASEISGSAEAWWRDPRRQAARAAFAEKYARGTDHYIGAWKRELLSASNLRSRGAG